MSVLYETFLILSSQVQIYVFYQSYPENETSLTHRLADRIPNAAQKLRNKNFVGPPTKRLYGKDTVYQRAGR